MVMNCRFKITELEKKVRIRIVVFSIKLGT